MTLWLGGARLAARPMHGNLLAGKLLKLRLEARCLLQELLGALWGPEPPAQSPAQKGLALLGESVLGKGVPQPCHHTVLHWCYICTAKGSLEGGR